MTILETQRLQLSRLTYNDSAFILELLNEPGFKRFIGDKQVKSPGDARRYLEEGPIGSYENFGYGMFMARHAESGCALGICGLVKRDQFDDPDLGFAFLQRYWRKGYALESASGVLEYGKETLRLKRIIAMADPENVASVRLLERLAFSYQGKVRMDGEEFDINLYARENP